MEDTTVSEWCSKDSVIADAVGAERSHKGKTHLEQIESKESLSAWAQWLLKKEKHLRESRKQKILSKTLEREKERIKQERQNKIKQEYEKWLTLKINELKIKKDEENNLKVKVLREKQQKEARNKELSKQKYQEWKSIKLKTLKEEEKAKLTQSQLEQEKKLQKERMNKAAFQKWCKMIDKRPKRMLYSFALKNKKLIVTQRIWKMGDV